MMTQVRDNPKPVCLTYLQREEWRAAEREGDDPGEDDPAQRAVEGHHDVVTVRFADRHVVVHYDEGHGNHGHLGGKAGFHY